MTTEKHTDEYEHINELKDTVFFAIGDAEHKMRAYARAVNSLIDRSSAFDISDNASNAARSGHFLSSEDMADLVEFKMDGDCDNTYRHTKETMKRLAKLGVVRGCGFARYEITSFGDYLIGIYFGQKVELPLQP